MENQEKMMEMRKEIQESIKKDVEALQELLDKDKTKIKVISSSKTLVTRDDLIEFMESTKAFMEDKDEVDEAIESAKRLSDEGLELALMVTNQTINQTKMMVQAGNAVTKMASTVLDELEED